MVKGNLTVSAIQKLNEKHEGLNLPEEKINCSVEYPMGSTIEEAVEIFGEKAVMSFIKFGAGHAVAGKVRDALADALVEGMDVEEAKVAAQNAVYADGEYVFRPGQGATRKSKVEKIGETLNSIEDEEEKAAQIAALKELLAQYE